MSRIWLILPCFTMKQFYGMTVGASMISIAALLFSHIDPLGFPSHRKLSSAFVFSPASLPVSTLASLLSISTESASLSVSWQLMPNFWLCFTGQATSSTPTVTIPQSSPLEVSQ